MVLERLQHQRTATVAELVGREAGWDTDLEEPRQEFRYTHRNRQGEAAEPLGCENDQARDDTRREDNT